MVLASSFSGIPTEFWVTVVAPAVITFFKAFKFVREGELGIKLRFGKAVRDRKTKEPKVIHPGFVVLIPFADNLRVHHVRQETIRFEHQQILTKEGLVFNINAIVIFRIKNVYRALFEIEHLEYSIEDLGMGILRDELSKRDHTELSDTAHVSEALLENIKHKAEEWGVEFIQFKLTSCAPTPETSSIITAKAGVKLKLEALRASVKDVTDLPPELAAVLLGVPLVASVSVGSTETRQTARPTGTSWLQRLFGNSMLFHELADASGSSHASENEKEE